MTDRVPALRGAWLQCQLRIRQVNPLTLLSGLAMLAAVVAWAIWLPQQRAALDNDRRELAQLRQHAAALTAAAPKPALTLNQQRVSNFYAALGDSRYAEQQLKTLFAIAAKNNLKLNQADYRNTLDRNSGVTAYQIDLPVTGPYPDIRLFCEQVLRAIPFASLDQISFKRQTVNAGSLDARVVLTVYLTQPAPAGELP